MDRHVLMPVDAGGGLDRWLLVSVYAIAVWLRPAAPGAGLNLFFWLGPALRSAGRDHLRLIMGSREWSAEIGLVSCDGSLPRHGIRQCQGKARPDPAVRAPLIARRAHDEVEERKVPHGARNASKA